MTPESTNAFLTSHIPNTEPKPMAARPSTHTHVCGEGCKGFGELTLRELPFSVALTAPKLAKFRNLASLANRTDVKSRPAFLTLLQEGWISGILQLGQ